MTLTDFLLARIAEDEAVLGVADSVNHYRFSSVRLAAECQTKRLVIERAQFVSDHGPAVDHTRALDMQTGAMAAFNDVLHFLALPYVNHPDYDEAWRP